MSNKKEALILMGHGSRVPGAGKGMEMVAEELLNSGDFSIVETCYMERLGVRFPEALKNCVDKGAEKVILIPYFLHMGLHTRVDIPDMMQHVAEKYPSVEIVFGKTLGFDNLLVELVRKRISESRNNDDIRNIKVAERDSYPLAEGEKVFVQMPPEEAEEFIANGGAHHHHHDD